MRRFISFIIALIIMLPTSSGANEIIDSQSKKIISMITGEDIVFNETNGKGDHIIKNPALTYKLSSGGYAFVDKNDQILLINRIKYVDSL